MSTTTTCGHEPLYCKGLCERCYGVAYRAANRERLAAKKRAYAQSEVERENERKTAWAAANAERVRENNRVRYQAKREHIRALQRAWRAANADHDNARRRAWRAANTTPEQARAQTNAWRATHPEMVQEQVRRRRARLAGASADLTSQQWQDILDDCDGCTYCGRQDLPLTLDHIRPLSRGGQHTASNVTPACGPCNSRKGAKTVDEFLAVLVQERAA